MLPDQWIVQQLVRLFLWRYAPCLKKELAFIHDHAVYGRLVHLKTLLGGCGEYVRLREGIQVIHPEKVFLGNFVDIGENCLIMGTGGVTIGDYCILANNTIIATTSHQVGGLYYGHDQTAPVVLGENVWTGSGVIILPGVTIGDNSIIGAGAVVTQEIPANKIALGVPARPVRDVPLDPVLRQAHVDALKAGVSIPEQSAP